MVRNRAVKIITFSSCNPQTSPLLNQLRLPRIQDMIQQETVGMIYKRINNQTPEYLTVLFNRASAMTVRTIRNAQINLRTLRSVVIFKNFNKRGSRCNHAQILGVT